MAPGYNLTTSGQKIPDGPIAEGIVFILEEENSAYGYENYGYEKLPGRLRRRFDLGIHKKKVYRLCRARELLWPQRQPKPLPPRRLPRYPVGAIHYPHL